MDYLEIDGGVPLKGSVRISGAKNAALPILFGTLLVDGEVVLHNVPRLTDIKTTLEILNTFGAQSEWNTNEKHILLQCTGIVQHIAPYDLVRKMRASILCLGPLLARTGQAVVSLPGGCAIGTRPVNLHLEALQKMGATIEIMNGNIHAKTIKLQAITHTFPMRTVTGTENIIMACALAEGTSVLHNCAEEPEVHDLCYFLNHCGAKITIDPQTPSTITIEGVSALKASKTPYAIMGDRIEAGTYLIAAAVTQGEVECVGISPHTLAEPLRLLQLAGFEVKTSAQTITLKGVAEFKGVDVETQPFPLFPTDLQAQWMALMGLAQNDSVINENIFENRFLHVPELCRLGAQIEVKNHQALVHGKSRYTGANVMATDLRASASLIIAGLAGKGLTTIRRLYHLDRGYENLEKKLSLLGAKVQRKKEE